MAGNVILVTWPRSGPFHYPAQTYRFSLDGSAWNQETEPLGLILGLTCFSLRLTQIPIFIGGAEKIVFKPNDLKREREKKRKHAKIKREKKATTRLSRIWRNSRDSLRLPPSLWWSWLYPSPVCIAIQIFVEHLLSVRHSSRCWDTMMNKTDDVTALPKCPFSWELGDLRTSLWELLRHQNS